MKTIIACVLTLILTVPAAADDYLPLATGNFWSYSVEDGTVEMRVVDEQVTIFDTPTFPIVYTESSENEGLINFWTADEDGGVLLWGFWRDTWGMVYDPPIRVVDAPLYVGKTWTNTVDLYALPDTSFYMTGEFTYSVVEDPELNVPAGLFPTFGIGDPDPDPAASSFLDGRYTLSGELRNSGNRGAYHWYSLNVGVVQEIIGNLRQLRTYTDHPVAVESSSWGAVKALYRGRD